MIFEFFILCVILVGSHFIKCQGDIPTLIKTPLGNIQGEFRQSYQGRIYTAFEGIPFAKPPVGELRFAEPQEPEKWDDVLIANRSYYCMCYFPFPGLRGIQGTEDCLYAYVYVPLKNITGIENLDVVVHVHGGGFMIGAPSYMAGPNYLMDKDIVFVSFNYRLAIFGFMSTEDNEVSGNNGLKDQVMALKWIKNNIKYFGGNPESITLTGISAGGASVHYHYLSPLSRGLFHKGLSQSGTVIQNWALVKHPLSKAQTVARNLHCPTNSTKEMVACLKKADAKKVILSMTKLYNYFDSIPFVIFGPVIEKGNNPFLPEHPYKMLKDGNVYDVPWIAANVKDEGLFPTAFFVMNQMMGELDTKWNEIAPYLLDLYETVDKSKQLDMMQKIKKFYFDDKPISDETTYNMVQMTSDRFYFMDCEKALRLQARVNKSPVYYYFFSYLLNKPILPTFGIKRGVGHGDDGALLFKMFGASSKLETKDEMMMKMFTEFLALYAKTGVPMMNNVEWKPIQPDSKMLNVFKVESPDEVKMIEMVKIGNNEFWDSMAIAENDKLCP